jgi:hypothetical protein
MLPIDKAGAYTFLSCGTEAGTSETTCRIELRLMKSTQRLLPVKYGNPPAPSSANEGDMKATRPGVAFLNDTILYFWNLSTGSPCEPSTTYSVPSTGSRMASFGWPIRRHPNLPGSTVLRASLWPDWSHRSYGRIMISLWGLSMARR